MIKVWESKNAHDKFLLITYRGKGARKIETLKIPLDYIPDKGEDIEE